MLKLVRIFVGGNLGYSMTGFISLFVGTPMMSSVVPLGFHCIEVLSRMANTSRALCALANSGRNVSGASERLRQLRGCKHAGAPRKGSSSHAKQRTRVSDYVLFSMLVLETEAVPASSEMSPIICKHP